MIKDIYVGSGNCDAKVLLAYARNNNFSSPTSGGDF
jgi:hypothetical protein